MATSEKGCCVQGCGKTRKDNTHLHSFPNPDKDMERYLEWTRAVGINKSSLDPQYVYKHRRVCHAHFEIKYLTWSKRLSPNAVPTIFLSGFETDPLEIPNTCDTDILDAASPPTSGELETTRVPLMNTTNWNENAVLDTKLVSTPIGEPSAPVEKPKLIEENTKSPKKKHMFNQKDLIKTIKKLQIKKNNYARRLKKALNLYENKSFLTKIKQFTPLAAMFTLMQFRESGKSKMGHRFTKPEKIMALSLYERSPSTYRWLENIFVLPSAMTLSRLIPRANLKSEITVTYLMK